MTSSVERASIRLDASAAVLAGGIVLSALFAALIMLHGVPALRQDWNWPYSPAQMHRFVIDTWSGWSNNGIGSASPYPSSYLLALPLWLLLYALGPTAALYVFLFGVGIVVVLGANGLAERAGSKPMPTLALIAFALFNPWVYVKVVAGHAIMVMAYGATMLLVAELFRAQPSWKRLALYLALVFAQLQFFLIAFALLAIRCRSIEVRKAAAFGLAIALPSIAGVIANWTSLTGTPYTLVWQENQSVGTVDASMLGGYFTNYGAPMMTVARAGVIAVVFVAVFGALNAVRYEAATRRYAAMLAVLGFLGWLVATGTKGPIAPVYVFAVSHAAVTGVYRELFDLLAYTAIAYIALAAFSHQRILHAIAFCGSLAAISSWIGYPPANYFVARSAVPDVQFSAPGNTRYALVPSFQPMSFHGQGSGEDPDSYRRTANVTPLNVYVAAGPEAAALASYARTGNSKFLSALSVSTIVKRPWLRTNDRSLSYQLGAGFAKVPETAGETIARIPYLPELTLVSTPLIGTVANHLGDGNIFWADARALRPQLPRFYPVSASNSDADAGRAWVSAPLTFVAHPDAFQAIGGAATQSGRSVLVLPPSAYVLVYVHGSLRNNTRLLSGSTPVYTWLATGTKSALRLTCKGYCVVAGYADAIPAFASNPAPRAYRAVHFTSALPWFVTASLPSTSLGAIRYNVRYNRWWHAYVDGRAQQHIRLDQTVNGWLVAESPGQRRLVIVNVAAALQSLFELAGVAATCFVLVSLARRRTART